VQGFYIEAKPGRTEIRLPTGGVVLGRATVDGAAPKAPLRLGVREGRPAGAEFVVPARLRARFADGSSCAGSEVVFETDATGRFRLEGFARDRDVGVAPLDAGLEASPGAAPPQSTFAIFGAAPLQPDGAEGVVALRTRPVLRGRLRLADGSPATPPLRFSAQLRFEGAVAGGFSAGAVAQSSLESDGSFSIPLSHAQAQGLKTEIDASVTPSPGAPRVSFPFTITPAAADDRQAAGDVGDVRLPAFRSVRFEIRDANGRPVSGARIGCLDGDVLEDKMARSDAAGVATIQIDAAPHEFTAFASGFGETRVPVEGDAAGPIRVTLKPGGRVVVKVVDAESRPVHGARVAISRPVPSAATTAIDFRGRRSTFPGAGLERGTAVQGSDSPFGGSPRSETTTVATTDREGLVVLRGVAAGVKAKVVVSDALGGAKLERTVDVGADVAGEAVVVFSGGARVFACRIFGSGDVPVRRATVKLETSTGSLVLREPDVDGAFRLRGLRAEELRIRITAEGSLSETVLESKPTDDGPPLDIKLAAKRVVMFDLVDAEGRPLVGATVTLAVATFGRESPRARETETPGRYAFDDLPPPPVKVIVQRPDRPFFSTLPDGDGVPRIVVK
jgi:hypothetical protein